MDGIRIVIHLVSCAPGLLVCNDLDTRALRFADMAECEARLPRLVAALQREKADSAVIMGRCRVQLERAAPRPANEGPDAGH